MTFGFNCVKSVLAFTGVLAHVPSIAAPGGYLIVSNTGVPFAWSTATAVPRDIDGGPFGSAVLVPDPVH